MIVANLDSSLKSIYCVYCIYGLDLCNYKREPTLNIQKNALSCCFGLIGVIHCVLNSFGLLLLTLGAIVSYTLHVFDPDDSANSFILSLTTCMILLTVEVLAYEISIIRNRTEIKRFYLKLSEIQYLLTEEEFRKCKRWALLMCFIPVIVVFTVGLFLAATILKSCPELYSANATLDEMTLLDEILDSNETWFLPFGNTFLEYKIFYCLEILNQFGFYYTVLAMTICIFYLVHLKGFILLFSIILRRLFTSLPNYCFTRSPVAHSYTQSRQLFITLHSELSKLVKTADCIYAPTTLVSYVIEASTIVFILRAANFGSIYEDASYFFGVDIISLIIPFCLSFTFLIWRTLILASVNEEISTTLKYLFVYSKDEGEESVKLYPDLLRYVNQSQMASQNLTGWRFFGVRTTCILAASGYILTYTLMLYGIQ